MSYSYQQHPYAPPPRSGAEHYESSPVDSYNGYNNNSYSDFAPSVHAPSYDRSTPQPRFQGQYHDEPSSRAQSPTPTLVAPYGNYEANGSSYALNPKSIEDDNYSLKKPTTGAYPRSYLATSTSSFEESSYNLPAKGALYTAPATKSRRKWIITGIVLGLVLLVAAGGLLLYLFVIKKHDSSASSSSSSGSSSSTGSNGVSNAITTGGDGSTVTLADGSKFTYTNPFNGYWVSDPKDPFNNGAKAQMYTPALNETWNWGVDKIYGVNLGGWLVTEPFIVPALFEKYYNTSRPIDEWHLVEAMRAANGGSTQELEDHYATFITEEDFARIAGAGLNWVRIPIGYWAIEVRDNEPFLEGVSWQYFLKAIEWARKYGIRINLDLHGVPGSQNGWNHSGRLGTINWLYGPAGMFNVQRSLEYIRIIAEFISQPQYKDVVAMFGIINEPFAPTISKDIIAAFYLQAHTMIRDITGIGVGNGPFLSLSEAFNGPSTWSNTLPNADRVALDWHPYLCFGNDPQPLPPSGMLTAPCNAWGDTINKSMSTFGMTVAGEFSLAVNDCGLWISGVDLGARYDGTFAGFANKAVGSCDPWNDWPSWTPSLRSDFKNFALSSMNALQNWFFWTWKIGNSSVTGKVEAPMWSYSLGLEQGWMPTDPRTSDGKCQALGVQNVAFTGPLDPWQTGGAGAGQIPASVTADLPFPPPSISAIGGVLPVTQLPVYTATGPVPTLPAPTFTNLPKGTTVDAGNGWFDSSDKTGAYVPISGCTYPADPWNVTSDYVLPDSVGCTAGGVSVVKRAAAMPVGY